MKVPALILALAMLLPFAAAADNNRCEASQPRNLKLDLAGVKIVMFDIGANKLRLDSAPGANGALQGKACASSAAYLEQLKVTQQREGNRLLVRAWRDGRSSGVFFGDNYAYLDLSGQVPNDILVQLKVGSGDAWLDGAASMSADVGSGDVEATRIRGLATAKVGSGDVVFKDIGSLKVLSIGSGDIQASNVRGAVDVGGIGSGDFELRGARGNVAIGSVKSGSAGLKDIEGDVSVDSIGSGDVDVETVRGNLLVRSMKSGSVDHHGVTGTVDVPR